MLSKATSNLFGPRLAFAASSAVGLGTSGLVFRDLADFSHWVHKPNRNSVMETFQNRHELTKAYLLSTLANTAIFWYRPAILPSRWIWAGFNATTLGLWFTGYINPELMMRPRNHNALYVSTSDARRVLNASDYCVVTKLENQEAVCFPDKQIMRPHIARIGMSHDGTPAIIAFCALTGAGVCILTPNLPDGRERELVPYIQLENNLVVLDKTTGHFGHQINLLDETKLLEKMGETDYNKVGRRPSQHQLDKLGIQPAEEIPSWRMKVEDFCNAFPEGKVFINDYQEYPDLKRPVLTAYDKLMQLVFSVAIGYHNKSPKPVFPTVDNIDPRLGAKVRVWGINVGDEYVAISEEFVRAKNRNFTVNDKPLVASWDPATVSVGIFVRPDRKAIHKTVDVYGNVKGTNQRLDRLSTVKAGLFWFAWQNFFPNTQVNPTK